MDQYNSKVNFEIALKKHPSQRTYLLLRQRKKTGWKRECTRLGGKVMNIVEEKLENST